MHMMGMAIVYVSAERKDKEILLFIFEKELFIPDPIKNTE